MKQITTLSFAILIMMASCRSTRTNNMETHADLFKNKWTLTELNGNPIAPASYEIPFLSFSKGDENRVSGNSSCNLLSGSFTFKKQNGLSFSQIASTRKACMNDNIEQEFLEMMGKVNQYQLQNNELTLLNGKDVLAKFKAGEDTASLQEIPENLLGTWQLNYISGKRIAFEGLYPDAKPTLFFTNEEPGTVGGNTSCNSFRTKLVLTDSTINVSDPGMMTLKACPGEGEQSFLQMLKKVNKYRVNADTLSLFVDEVEMMRFNRQ